MSDHSLMTKKKMASGHGENRCVFQTSNVTVELNIGTFLDSTVKIFNNELRFIQNESTKMVILLSNVRSIEIHQPIFGANYITGEYVDQGGNCSMTMTFNKGGATEFARAFFRLAEGELVTTETTPIQPPVVDNENKKNV